jgi:hypothetical protein
VGFRVTAAFRFRSFLGFSFLAKFFSKEKREKKKAKNLME